MGLNSIHVFVIVLAVPFVYPVNTHYGVSGEKRDQNVFHNISHKTPAILMKFATNVYMIL